MVLALVMAALLAYAFRRPLLASLGNLWVVDESVQLADAVVVLGGGLQQRPAAAAGIVARGIATNVLVAHVKSLPTDTLAITENESTRARKVLMTNGVSETYIHFLGTNVSSTIDEAHALRAWALEHHPKVIIIPTDLFHTRRVNWLMEKQLHDLHVDVRVIALDNHEYNRTNWWQHEQGVIAFQNEVLKYFLYRCKY